MGNSEMVQVERWVRIATVVGLSCVCAAVLFSAYWVLNTGPGPSTSRETPATTTSTLSSNNRALETQSRSQAILQVSQVMSPRLDSRQCAGETFPLVIRWTNKMPTHVPLSTQKKCNVSPLNASQIQSCFSGRRVFVLGNSIARQFAFGLAEAFGVEHVSRQGQLQVCPKNNLGGEITCTPLKNDNITIVSSWYTYFRSRAREIAHFTLWQEDVCGDRYGLYDATGGCFEEIIGESSKPSDVLVFSIGLWYVMYGSYQYDDDSGHLRSDREAITKQAVLEWISMVTRLFQGTVIYLDIPPVRDRGDMIGNPDQSVRDQHLKIRQHSQDWNQFVVPLILENSNFLVFDLWSFVHDVQDDTYTDTHHFPGPMTNKFGWSILARMVCPQFTQ